GQASAFASRAAQATACAPWAHRAPPTHTAPSASPSMRSPRIRCAKRTPSSWGRPETSLCSTVLSIEVQAHDRKTGLYVTPRGGRAELGGVGRERERVVAALHARCPEARKRDSRVAAMRGAHAAVPSGVANSRPNLPGRLHETK